MQHLEELYYSERENKIQYTDRNTGNLDVIRFVQNLPYWVDEQAVVKKPKKILIPCWVIQLFSDSEQKEILEFLKNLIDKNFEIYYQHLYGIEALGKEELEKDFSLHLKPNLSVREIKMPAKDELVLDDLIIQKLIDFKKPYFINGIKFLSCPEEIQDFFIKYNQQRGEKIQRIIYDTYPVVPQEIESLQNKFQDSQIVYEFKNAYIRTDSLDYPTAEFINLEYLKLQQTKETNFTHLLSETTHTLELNGDEFDAPSCKNHFVKTLKLDSFGINEESLNNIFNFFTNLINLEVSRMIHLPISQNFSMLESLDLTDMFINQRLGEILAGIPRIKHLNMSDCFDIEEELTQEINLSNLESLKISASLISNNTLATIVNSTSNLKILVLSDCSFKEQIILLSKNFYNLEELDLKYQAISIANLKSILVDSPNLKRLSASVNEEDHYELARNSLLHLKQLNLQFLENITFKLQDLLIAAPNIKELILRNGGLNNASLNLLQNIETIEFGQMNFSLYGLYNLLSSAKKIKKIQLEFCDDIYGILPAFDNILEDLAVIDIIHCGISAESLQPLYDKAPNLQMLKIKEDSTEPENSIILLENSLLQLKEVDIKPCTARTIESFLKAAPKLRYCTFRAIDEICFELEANTLPLLTFLKLKVVSISTKRLISILKAAPGVTTFNLSFSDDLNDERLADIQAKKNNIDLQLFFESIVGIEDLSLSGVYFPENFCLDENSLRELEKFTLSDSYISFDSLLVILKSAPNLKILNISETKGLDNNIRGFLKTHYPNITIRFSSNVDYIYTNASNVSVDESNVSVDESNVSVDESNVSVDESNVSANVPDFEHDSNDYLNYTPKKYGDIFQFNEMKNMFNQGMIINKLCQYLTITGEHIENIPRIQEGMCGALAGYFVKVSLGQWDDFIEKIAAWNGRDEITDELKKYFDILWEHYSNFYIQPLSSPRQYIGDGSIVEFLKDYSEGALLKNPWHSIGVKKIENKWIVYDPNYRDGRREIENDEDLEYLIRRSLGNILAIRLDNKIDCKISNANKFIAEGGLLTLYLVANSDNILQVLNSVNDWSHEDLQGLLCRGLKGMPAWYRGLASSQLRDLTFNLLKKFAAQNPHTFKIKLKKSAEHCQAYQDHESLIDSLIADNSPIEEQVSRALSPWTFTNSSLLSIDEYCQELLSVSPDKKILIELDNINELDALSFKLQYINQQTNHRPIYYIETYRDLVCCASFIEVDENFRGVIRKGPGGPLHDFLIADYNDDNPPLIIVNFEFFEVEDVVGLLDEPRTADGTKIPENAQIICLISKTNSKRADFYSHFNKREYCPVAKDELVIPDLPFFDSVDSVDSVDSTAKPFVIQLFANSNWTDILVGKFGFNNGEFYFEQGLLQRALQDNNIIEIQNGLWTNREFQKFWRDAFIYGYIKYGAGEIHLPTGFKIKRADGYDWESLLNDRIASLEEMPEDAYILNHFTLQKFFKNLQFQDGSIVNESGFIAENANRTINIHVTGDIDEHQWARILIHAKAQNVFLNIYTAPNIHLHGLTVQTPQYSVAQWDKSSNNALKIIKSSDVDTTIALLVESQTADYIIDISECTISDLFEKININNSDTFSFVKIDGVLKKLNEDKKTIILYGNFSQELLQELASFLLKLHFTNQAQGKLILVADKDTSFNYLPDTQIHEVLQEEKLSCIEGMPLELLEFTEEPLTKLKARAQYLKIHSDSLSCWEGIERLSEVPALEELNDQSHLIADEFDHMRLTQISQTLKIAPYVLITGLSGVGKSTFVIDKFSNNHVIYQNNESLLEWINMQSDSEYKILFIDEVTLTPSNWSIFEGLFQNPAHILVNSKVYLLSDKHKIIFAGNPVSYGSGRKAATLFLRHGNAVVFNPLPSAVLYEKVLKPLLQQFVESNTISTENLQKICKDFLNVYNFIVSCSTSDVLISPRELEMMTVLTILYCIDNGVESIEHSSKYYAYMVTKNLIPRKNIHEFNKRFAPSDTTMELFHEDFNSSCSEDFVLTQSRKNLKRIIEDLLNLRKLKQKPLERRFDKGLGGIIIEGEPATGKSHLLQTIFSQANVQDDVIEIPATMLVSEIVKTLQQAFKEGKIVTFCDSSILRISSIEKELNSMLMGKTLDNQLPENPGFMIIVMQNAAENAPSTAVSRRLLKEVLPVYTENEMLHILTEKGVDAEVAKTLVDIYTKQLNYAKREYPQSCPSFRNLLDVAREYIIKSTLNTSNSNLSNQSQLNASNSNLFFTRQNIREDIIGELYELFSQKIKKWDNDAILLQFKQYFSAYDITVDDAATFVQTEMESLENLYVEKKLHPVIENFYEISMRWQQNPSAYPDSLSKLESLKDAFKIKSTHKMCCNI